MSKSFCALLILAACSGPAWSQTRGESVSTGSARHFSHLFKGDTQIDDQQSRPCLVRKATGRTECRSRAGWRRLARQMDEARRSGQEPR